MNRPHPLRPVGLKRPQLPYRPPSRPDPVPDHRELYKQLGLSVTICLAGLCWSDNCIVAVSDRRLSYDDYVEATDDGALKAFQLTLGWGLLFAADDISPIPEIVRDIRARLRPLKDTLTAAIVQDVVCQAYQNAVHTRIVSLYLAKFGIKSVDEFRQTGLKDFGPEIFGQLVEKIEGFGLGVTLLIYGFDDPPEAGGHLFEVRNPGIAISHNMEGFGAIGSGSLLAQGQLTIRGANGLATVKEAIYRLLEAKFSAESASGVGKATTVMVFGVNGKMRQLPPGEIDKLRSVWVGQRQQPLPPEVETILGDRFKKLMETDE